jgi:restriction system protein
LAIPDYQAFMKPLLEFASDRQEHSIREAYERMAEHFELSDDDRSELLPSGRQATYKNRVGWARTYLAKAGLLENTRRAHFRITDRGLEELQNGGDEISTSYLKKYDEFRDFQRASSRRKNTEGTDAQAESTAARSSATPEEQMDRAYNELTEQLAGEVLTALHQASPSFFEQVVIELLVAMGYGGSRREAARQVGRSGDAGIDGIIKEDRLGLDAIYIQAKRWEGAVGRPEIQKFVGALQGRRAHKGIFITASHFTSDAREYADQVQTTVILLDGADLARLMIEHGVGVTAVGTYTLKRLDSDYFLEE